MLDCNTLGGDVWMNGKVVKETFLSRDAVVALKVSGDIQCRLLHVHVSVDWLKVIVSLVKFSASE